MAWDQQNRGGFISEKQVSIQIVRRALASARPGLTAPEHVYRPVVTTRSSVKTTGISEFASIDIDGKRITHTFTIRWTSVPFDTRDRVRDARGQFYQILRIDNVDMRNKEYRIHTASVGHESVVAAQ